MAKDRKVRFGIIGSTGLIGTYHANVLYKGQGPYELRAVCDAAADRLAEQAQRLNVPGTTSVTELLARDDLDAVIVATPHPLHPEHVIAVVESGRDVLTEKPLASTLSGARGMIKAINRKRRIAAIHFQQRANPVFMKAKRMIASGELGRLLAIRLTGSWYKSDYYYSLGGWRGTWENEGGATLINQAPHDLDLLCFLAAGDRPAELVGRCSNLYHGTSQGEDHATASGRFPNGVDFSIDVSVALTGDLARFEIFGSAGVLTIQGGKFLRYVRFEQDVIDFCHTYAGPDPYAGPEVKPHELPTVDREHDPVDIHRSFAEAVLTRKKAKLLSPAAEGLWSMELICAIRYSSYTGKAVKCPISPLRYDKMLADLIATAQPVERQLGQAPEGMEAR